MTTGEDALLFLEQLAKHIFTLLACLPTCSPGSCRRITQDIDTGDSENMEYALGHRRLNFSDGRADKMSFGGHNGISSSIMDDDYATAVAAAAFAIHSLEESQIREPRKTNEVVMKTASKREDATKRKPPSFVNTGEASMKRSTTQDPGARNRHLPSRATNSTFTVPVASTDKSQQQKQSFLRHKNSTRADAWERAKLEKIRKRYETIKFQTLAWENKKKMHAKLKMEKKQKELESRIASNLQHYRRKLAWIDKIARGARAQAEERRRSDESNAREMGKKVKITGRVPTSYFCFSCPRLI